MTQENRLREKIAEILDNSHYSCTDRECERDHSPFVFKETLDAILSAVRESLPKENKMLVTGMLSQANNNGWNAYRKEMLKLLGAKDAGE